MAKILARTPHASIVQQDDGSVLTLPPGHDLVPPDAQPIASPSFVAPESPVPVNALAAPVPPQDATTPPDPMGAPPTVAPTAPVSLAPTPADQPGAPAPVDPYADAPPAVDAVSGASATPAAAIAPPQPAAPAPIDPYAPPPMMSAEDRALSMGQLAARQAQDRADILAEATDRAAKIDAARAEAAAEIQGHREAVQAQADKAIADYVNFDMKPEDRRSAGNVLALIFGGIGNVLMNRGAAENPVIGILERKADAAAREKAAKVQKLGANVDLRNRQVDSLAAFAKDSDAYYHAKKAGELENFARQIESAAAGYDSQQEQLKAQDVVAQLRAKAAEAAQAAAEAEHKRQVEAIKLQQDAQRIATDQYQAKTGRLNAYTTAGQLKESKRQFNATFQATQEQRAFDNDMKIRNFDLEIEKAKAEGRQKDVSTLREQRESEAADAARRVGVMPVTKRDADGKVIGSEMQELANADGKPFRANDPTRAQELTSKMAATTEAVHLLDRLIRLRDDHGWSSDLLKSDEFRQMRATYGQLVLVSKDAGGLGALSGPDMGLIHSVLGTSDPTEVRDPGAGLAEARRNMIGSFNSTLRANGYTGEQFDIPDVVTKGGAQKEVKNTPEEQVVNDIAAGSKDAAGGIAARNILSGEDPATARGRNYELSMWEEQRIMPTITVAASGRNPKAQAALAVLADDRLRGAPIAVTAALSVDPKWITAEDKDARLDEIAKTLYGEWATPERIDRFRKDNLGALKAGRFSLGDALTATGAPP